MRVRWRQRSQGEGKWYGVLVAPDDPLSRKSQRERRRMSIRTSRAAVAASDLQPAYSKTQVWSDKN